MEDTTSCVSMIVFFVCFLSKNKSDIFFKKKGRIVVVIVVVIFS